MSDSPPFIDTLTDNISDIWKLLINQAVSLYDKATSTMDEEFSLPVSQNQLNMALKQYVTDNVTAILDMRIELHEEWFRLFCTIEVSGIYTEVASNFRLVHVQMDSEVQRFVFAQLANTDVLILHCESFIKRLGIKAAIWFYHRLLKKDPLGVILSYINIARPKENIIYLDIHRWLKKNKKIMSALQKVQVNYGIVEQEQLILKSQLNLKELLSNSRGEDILTPDNESELMEGPINPITDATEPSLQ